MSCTQFSVRLFNNMMLQREPQQITRIKCVYVGYVCVCVVHVCLLSVLHSLIALFAYRSKLYSVLRHTVIPPYRPIDA